MQDPAVHIGIRAGCDGETVYAQLVALMGIGRPLRAFSQRFDGVFDETNFESALTRKFVSLDDEVWVLAKPRQLNVHTEVDIIHLVVRVDKARDSHCLSAIGFEECWDETMDALLKERVVWKPDRLDSVYLIANGGGGLELVSIDGAGAEFQPDNYSQGVQKEYEIARAELEAKYPKGRLVLIDGKPGTGKTFLVRALIHAVAADWIFIPAGLFGDMDTPDLVPLLARHRGKCASILVVEDADLLLKKRDDSTLSEISTLLNMTSGIIGDLLDIRVVCTTNLDKLDIDEALLRPMRLAQRIHTEEFLQYGQVETILRRMCGAGSEELDEETRSTFKSFLDKKLTLAGLYEVVADLAIIAERRSTRLPDVIDTTFEEG